MYDVSGATWRKSTRSGSNGGDCVEIADNLPDFSAIRDSKDPNGAVLVFSEGDFRVFIDGIKRGFVHNGSIGEPEVAKTTMTVDAITNRDVTLY
jgi:hypothetical protein